jgi:hypothetical protein
MASIQSTPDMAGQGQIPANMSKENIQRVFAVRSPTWSCADASRNRTCSRDLLTLS